MSAARWQSVKAQLAGKTVIGRVGTPREIATAIYFLADNQQSSFMTGQPVIVDGGATIRSEHRIDDHYFGRWMMAAVS